MHHDWMIGLFKKVIVHLPLSNCTSGNLLRSLGAQNEDLGFALQTLLARDTLNLQQRLERLNGDGAVKKKGGIIINITGN